MAKFKKGDRVVYRGNIERGGDRKWGSHGVVDEDNSTGPWVLWISGARLPTVEQDMELIKEDKVEEIKIDAARIEKIKQAAKDCPTTKKALETIFPEAFAEEWSCCPAWKHSVKQGVITRDRGYWAFPFTNQNLSFCPFCGVPVAQL